MIDESGGGASRTTDPAAGTSQATDVSLKEFIDQRFTALELLLDERRDGDLRAVTVAKETADAALAAHNDLIKRGEAAAKESQRQLDKLTATYATLDMVQVLEKSIDTRLQAIEGKLEIGTATRAAVRGSWSDLKSVVLGGFFILGVLLAFATYLAQT